MGTITNKSYDYTNPKRDLSDIFTQLIQSYPTFLSQVMVGQAATSTKYEWMERQLTPTESAISALDPDGDGTGITVASTAGIRAGAILGVRKATGASVTEQVQVASVDSATELTVVRDYGSTTGVTLVVGDILFVISSPLSEATEGVKFDTGEPLPNYNYTQIFERKAVVSRTEQNIGLYGIEDALSYKVEEQMISLMREMNNQAIYGRRVVRSGSAQGSFGGILQFMESGNVDNVGGALTSSALNDGLETIFQDGGFSNNYAFLCSENQARKISALNTAGSNPLVMKNPEDRNFGGYISTFTGDLPVQGGFMAKIVVDPNFPRDQVAIVDMNSVSLHPLVNSALSSLVIDDNNFDGEQRRLIGEYTMKVQNGKQSHALLTGLTL